MSEAAQVIDFPSTQTVEGVLVQISIRQWKGIKIDRNVTDEVAVEKTGSCRNVGSYQKRLFSDCCADPGLFVYSCCCPCLLTGQISQEMGRNCCAAPRGRHICGRPLDRWGSHTTHGRRRRGITS